MNARTPEVSPVGLSLAAGNAAVLRVLVEGPWTGSASDLARQAGVDVKNIGRTLTNFYREGLARHVLADDPKPSGEGDHVEITDAGRHALSVADFAAGRAAPPTGPAADPDNDVLLLAHHQMRPNPLNPRKLKLGEPGDDPPTKDRRELDELKATIVAAGDVLQNLVVFPAGEDGVHDLSAGERRWRAVGELIEEGFWPRDRRLRAIEKANDPGRVSFLALVENGQRASLGKIEEARAFQALCNETGWSARKAAEHCGRDARTVQQFLQVLRDADPDDIARHEANPEAYTWDELRKSVQKGADADADDGARDPNQVDLEDVVGEAEPTRPFAYDARDRELLDYTRGHYSKLTARLRLMLVELADKLLRDPHPLHEGWTLVAPDHVGTTSDFILAGAGFMSGGGMGYSLGHVGGSTLELLRLDGLLTACGDRTAILDRARREAGVAEAKLQEAASKDAYVTPWLDPQWKPERKPVDSGLVIGGAGSVQAPKPPRQALGPDALLKPVERLAMAELASHLRTRPDGKWGDDPVARVYRYWLDQTSSDLQAYGFVVFNHVMKGGPWAALTKAGWAWVDANVTLLNAGAITVERQKAGLPREGAGYSTPWLNEPEGDAPGRTPGEVTAQDVEDARAAGDDDAEELARRLAEQRSVGGALDEEFQEAEALLQDVARALDSSDDFDPLPLFARAGIKFPLAITDVSFTVSSDRGGDDLFDLCGAGDLPDDMMRARALLLTYALNAFAADWRTDTSLALPIAGKGKEPAEPAVPIRRSIYPSLITNLDDGMARVSLRRDLQLAYRMSPDAYRERWKLPRDYPLVAPNEMKSRSDLLRSLGVEAPSFDEDGEG